METYGYVESGVVKGVEVNLSLFKVEGIIMLSCLQCGHV